MSPPGDARRDDRAIGDRTIRWARRRGDLELRMRQIGSGPSVVLLPALSSISTLRETDALGERLAARHRVTSVDWPGFGDLPRAREDWGPETLTAFLHWFLTSVLEPPHAVVAAGHAATYAMHQAAHATDTVTALALVAPTWRGPLPTMMGYRPALAGVRAALDNPIVGPTLYRLNVSRPVVRKMAREHVYGDAAFLDGERLSAKEAVTKAPGARHASVRFVSGALDRVRTRRDFLDLAALAKVPTLVLHGRGTPARSKAEMEALAAVGADVRELDAGRLGLHEEHPGAVADAVLGFLARAADRPPRVPPED